MSLSSQLQIFEVSRVLPVDSLKSFLKYCDKNDRGIGWTGLERALYRIRPLPSSDAFEFRATWSFASSHGIPVLDLLKPLVTIWDREFAMSDLVETASGDFSQWQIIHTYFGNDRQDCRSPLMDDVVARAMVKEPENLRLLRERAQESGLPPISLSPQDGNLLKNLLVMAGCKRGVEIGTLGGYSAAWICEAIGADGMLITIEKDAKRSRWAAENLALAGYGDRVECRAGNAHLVLENLKSQGPWDFVFIDADKSGYGTYVDWAMKNLKPGGLILADNAYLWGGMLTFPNTWVDEPSLDLADSRLHGFDAAEYRGMSEAWQRLSHSEEFDPWMLPIPDGMLVARKRLKPVEGAS